MSAIALVARWNSFSKRKGILLMKKWSRILALCTVVALCGACLGGCSAEETADKGGAPIEKASEGEGQGRPTAAQAQEESPANSGQDSGASATATPQAATRFDTSGTIEPTTILDNDVLTVAVESLEYRNDNAYLKLSFTNNTEGELDVTACTLGYSANYVNDCMVDLGWISCDVPAGETAEDEASFSLQNLQLYGIQKIGVFGLGIRAVNEDYDEVFKDMVEVATSLNGTEGIDSSTFVGAIDNPALLKKLEGKAEPVSSIASDLDGTGLEITAAYLLTNKDDEITVATEIRNNTDETLVVQTKDITIDGTTAYEGLWSSDTVAAGKRFILDSLQPSSLAEYGDNPDEFDLSNIKEIGMTIAIKDVNGNTILDSAEVTITF